MAVTDQPSAATLRRWRRRLADERLEATTYRQLATRRSGEEREILLALADAESRHAAHWERLLGPGAAAGRPGLRATLLAVLARYVGSVLVLALAERAETRSPYADDADATPTMAADERVHAEVVRALAARGRARLSGTFRAAVFGANDGLVSNLALVLGVSAAGAARDTVLVTALAGLLAGALSMGAGEFISVRSQRELLEASTSPTTVATTYPHLDVNANELALIYRARGMSPEQAGAHAVAQLTGTVAGVEEPSGHATADRELVGNGWSAALSSFTFFASGAAVPALPFVLGLGGAAALVTACVAVAVALLLTGAFVGVLSGASLLTRALRQLGVGAAAATVTYGLGSLFGAALS